MTTIYAHRGASAYAPENTLEAFRLAAEMGAHGVELDVHVCKSGELVVIHDETVDRVADGTGTVAEMTLAELKALNVSKPIPGYKPTTIPTLEEVYELLKPTGLHVNVELKTGYVDYPTLVEKCVALAEKMGMTDRVLYSSFNHRTLLEVKAINPAVPTAHALWQEINPWTVNTEEEIRMCIAAGCDRLITNYPDRALKILHNI